MSQFLNFLLKLLAIVIICAFAIDTVITYSYPKLTARSHADWIFSLPPETSFDCIFLGSSRSSQHVIPKMIEEQTGKKCANFGYAASKPFEIKLTFMALRKRIHLKKVFIQIDQSWNISNPDVLAQSQWMPYIKKPEIQGYFKDLGNDYIVLSYIPLIRYSLNNPKIGVRNLFFKLVGKELDVIPSLGYSNSTHPFKNKKISEYEAEIHNIMNPHIKEIIDYCNGNQIQLFFYTAPFYKNTIDFSPFNSLVRDYHDFSREIPQNKFYLDPYHLNESGSKKFTQQIIDYYFKIHEEF